YGGDAAAVPVAHVSETTTRGRFLARDGNRLVRRLGGGWGGNLRARCRVRSDGDALGSPRPCRSLPVGCGVDCCRGVSIHALENDWPAPLPFAIRLRQCLPGTRNRFPTRLQTR